MTNKRDEKDLVAAMHIAAKAWPKGSFYSYDSLRVAIAAVLAAAPPDQRITELESELQRVRLTAEKRYEITLEKDRRIAELERLYTNAVRYLLEIRDQRGDSNLLQSIARSAVLRLSVSFILPTDKKIAEVENKCLDILCAQRAAQYADAYMALGNLKAKITEVEAENARLRHALEIAGPMAYETGSASTIKIIHDALAATSRWFDLHLP